MNIDVVSDPSDNVPPDPEHREIGGYGYIELTELRAYVGTFECR